MVHITIIANMKLLSTKALRLRILVGYTEVQTHMLAPCLLEALKDLITLPNPMPLRRMVNLRTML